MSLIRLNRLDRRFLLTGYDRVRRSPTQFDQWEVRATIIDVEDSANTVTPLWCPFSDIGRVPPYQLLGRRSGSIVRSSKPKRRRLKNLRLMRQSTGVGETAGQCTVDLFQPHQTYVKQWSSRFRYLIFQDARDEQIVVDRAEAGRFYFSLVGLIAQGAFRGALGSTNQLGHLIDWDTSGLYQDGLVIAPRRSYCGLASVLQIALLMADQEFERTISNAGATMHISLDEHGEALLAANPTDPLDLLVEGQTKPFRFDDGTVRDAFVVTRIVSDNRPPPPVPILVRYPFAAFPVRPDEKLNPDGADIDDTESNNGSFVGPNTQITRDVLPSDRTIRLGSAHNRFSTKLPAWSKAQMRYEWRASTDDIGSGYRRALSQRSPIKTEAARATTARGGRDAKGGIPRIETGSDFGDKTGIVHEERVREARSFVIEAASAELQSRVEPLEGAHEMLCTFLAAGIEIINWQWPEFCPNIPGEGSQGLLLTLPAEWGGIASPTRDGQPRRIAALPLEFRTSLVWAVEIERRVSYEQYSMGLIAVPRDGVSEWPLLNDVLYTVCQRSRELRGRDDKGLWPDADYTDVRLTPLIHSPNRANPEVLGGDILDRASFLAHLYSM